MYLNRMYSNNENGNQLYKISNAKRFNSIGEINYEYRIASFRFAYAMTFSNEGHHRRNRSGGNNKRKKVELFCDTFLGKLGEFAVYQYFYSKGVRLEYPDLSIMGKGEWDSYDFVYRSEKIGVKTTKSIGNVLLLETKDWDREAQYIPNISKGSATYDHMLFVRLSNNIVSNLKKKRLYFTDDISEGVLESEFKLGSYNFDIAHVPIDKVRSAIKDNYIIRKGDYLQTVNTKMDAENYYIQSGDMLQIDNFINSLKLYK